MKRISTMLIAAMLLGTCAAHRAQNANPISMSTEKLVGKHPGTLLTKMAGQRCPPRITGSSPRRTWKISGSASGPHHYFQHGRVRAAERRLEKYAADGQPHRRRISSQE